MTWIIYIINFDLFDEMKAPNGCKVYNLNITYLFREGIEFLTGTVLYENHIRCSF